MLTRDELVVDLNVIRDTGEKNKNAVQGFYGRRNASYRDFVINQPREPAFYEGVDDVVMEIDPLSLGADYWDQNRHVPLTAKENAIYHMVDTMKTIPRFNTYIDVISTVITGYYSKGDIDYGPYFSVYSFNPVEGHRFRLGARTSSARNAVMPAGSSCATRSSRTSRTGTPACRIRSVSPQRSRRRVAAERVVPKPRSRNQR